MASLTVLFPGIGYTCDRPLLYYAKCIAKKNGYEDIIQVQYEKVDKAGLQGNHEKMTEVFKKLYESSVKYLADVEWEKYDKILFISKSVGTAIAACYEENLIKDLANKGIKLPPIKQVLFTPLEETMIFNTSSAIAFIGTSDPWSDYSKVVEAAKHKNIPIHIYDNANHSLETGNVKTDLDYLKDAMEKCKKFIEEKCRI